MSIIEIHQLLTITSTTPNSVFPVLVYRNVLTKAMTDPAIPERQRQQEVNNFFKAHGWTVDNTWPSVTHNHYHPNVHETYAVIAGSSTLILGLDVNITPDKLSDEELDKLDNYLRIKVNTGDVITLPAGVAHCSRHFDKDYRYAAAYPSGSLKYMSISSAVTKRSEEYDNRDDIELTIKADFPTGDPVFGTRPDTLVDVWKKQTQVC